MARNPFPAGSESLIAHSLKGLHFGEPLAVPALNITTSGVCIKILVTGPVDVPACAQVSSTEVFKKTKNCRIFFMIVSQVEG